MKLPGWLYLLGIGVALVQAGCSPRQDPPTATAAPSLTAVLSTTSSPALTSIPPARPTPGEANRPTPLVFASPLPTATRLQPIAVENTAVPGGAERITLENIDHLAELARWGSGNANDLAFSPDGLVLAVASSMGLYLYDDHDRLQQILPSTHALTGLAFSPDGTWLAAGDVDGKIQLWDWRARSRGSTLDSGWHQPVGRLVFSPDSRSIGYILATPLIVLQVQAVPDGRVLFKSPRNEDRPFSFTPDGSAILIPGSGVWRVAIPSGETADLAKLDGDRILTSVQSPDGRSFAAAGRAGIYLWKAGEDKPYQTIEIPVRAPTRRSGGCQAALVSDLLPPVNSLAISPDGQLLAIGLVDGSLQFRRMVDGVAFASAPSRFAQDEEEGIRKIIFHPRQAVVAILYHSGEVELRDARSAGLLRTVGDHTGRFTSLAFSPAGDAGHLFLAAGASDVGVRVWNLATGRRSQTFAAQAETLAFSPGGELLGVGSRDGSVRWIRMFDGRPWGPWPGHLDAVTSLAFLSGGKLVSASRDCTLQFWDIASGAQLSFAGGDSPPATGPVVQVLSPASGKNLILLKEDRRAWLFSNPMSEKAGLEPLDPLVGATWLALSADGRLLAGINYQQVVVLDLQTRQTVASWKSGGTALAFSPDAKLLAIGDEKGQLVIHGLENDRSAKILAAHRGAISGLAFSADGRFLASAGNDGAVRAWGIP